MNSHLVRHLTNCRLIHHLNSQLVHHPVNSQPIHYLTHRRLSPQPMNSHLVRRLTNCRLIHHLNSYLVCHPVNSHLVRRLTNCRLIRLLTLRCMHQKNGYLRRVKETNGFESLMCTLPHARIHHLTLAVTYPNCPCWFLLAI